MSFRLGRSIMRKIRKEGALNTGGLRDRLYNSAYPKAGFPGPMMRNSLFQNLRSFISINLRFALIPRTIVKTLKKVDEDIEKDKIVLLDEEKINKAKELTKDIIVSDNDFIDEDIPF